MVELPFGDPNPPCRFATLGRIAASQVPVTRLPYRPPFRRSAALSVAPDTLWLVAALGC